LRAFDDAWHADSLGGAGGRRIPWSRLSGSATAIEPDGKLVISVVETGRKGTLGVRVPVPNCSAFDRQPAAHLCAGSRPSHR